MTSILALTLSSILSNPAALPPRPDSSGAVLRPPLAAQAVALALERRPVTPEATATRAAMAQPGGDSLKNGAIIGAVIAGVGMGALVYTLCRAVDDTGGGANCAGAALIWTGIAGAGGAAVGAGVDALFDRQPRFRAGVRFRF